MNVSALYVYPVKGAAGIAVTSAQLDAFGFEHDRRFMCVDADGGFISQRDCHELALLDTQLGATELTLRSARAGDLNVSLRPTSETRLHVRIWQDRVNAIDAGDAAATFVTRHLGRAARLVFMPDHTLRQADLTYAQKGDRVSFADAFPLLLIGQSSLDELNRRVGEQLSMRRFRPNIVVSGAPPHAEDSWRRIRIADIECDVVKPCARCAVTTIDPDTGIAAREPLRTLATYRATNGQVYFGQNVIHRAHGWITVGDTVTVQATGAARPSLQWALP